MAERKRLVMNFQFIFCKAKSNFQISDRTLFFDFKNAWKILAFRKAAAQSAAARTAENPKNESWLGLLNEIRTFFEENPNSDF